MRFYSDDPVRDFDRWDAEQEIRRERSRRGRCAHCKEPVFDWEDHYEFDGDVLVHEDCLRGWAEKYRRNA